MELTFYGSLAGGGGGGPSRRWTLIMSVRYGRRNLHLWVYVNLLSTLTTPLMRIWYVRKLLSLIILVVHGMVKVKTWRIFKPPTPYIIQIDFISRLNPKDMHQNQPIGLVTWICSPSPLRIEPANTSKPIQDPCQHNTLINTLNP